MYEREGLFEEEAERAREGSPRTRVDVSDLGLTMGLTSCWNWVGQFACGWDEPTQASRADAFARAVVALLYGSGGKK